MITTMEERQGGGTALDTRPAWMLPAGGAVVALLIVGFFVFGSKSSKNNSGRALDEAAELEEYVDESAVLTPSAAVPAPSAQPTKMPVAREQLAEVKIKTEIETGAEDEVDVDRLLFELRVKDGLVAPRAAIKLAQLGQQERAIPVLLDLVRSGDASQARDAQMRLGDWGVKTISRSIADPPQRPEGKMDYHDALVEVQGNNLHLQLHYYFDWALFDSKVPPPYVEISVRGPNPVPSKKFVGGGSERSAPRPGDNKLSAVIATGIASGPYEVSIFFWGQNKNTQVQHNFSAPTLIVEKP
jgi:hypothetical protein